MRILVNYESAAEYSHGKIYAKYLAKLGHNVYTFSDVLEMYNQLSSLRLSCIKRIADWSLQKKHYWGFLQAIPVAVMDPLLGKLKQQVNKKLIALCKSISPEIFIVFKGKVIYPETLETIRDTCGCKLLYFNGDYQFNLYSTSENMLKSLVKYDCVFTCMRWSIKELEENGAKNVKYLPVGYDPDLHFPVDVSSEDLRTYGHDVVFVGTWDKDRESTLSVLADLDLGIWGSRWSRVSWKSPLCKCIRGGVVNAETMRKIYGASTVCLNIMRPQNRTSHNNKSFEIPAMGGFMVADRSIEMLKN